MKIVKQIAISGISIAMLLAVAPGGAVANGAPRTVGARAAGQARDLGAAALPKSCKTSKPVIGVSLPDTSNPYYVYMRQGFLQVGAKYGFDVKMAIANDDDSNQLYQIDAFIQEGVCAVALNPVTSGPSAADVAALNKAGIPVFTVNVLVDQADLTKEHAKIVQFVGANQAEGGKVEALQVLKDLGAKAKILVGTVGDPLSQTTAERDAGFYTVIKRDPNAKVGELVNGQVEPTVSLQVATDMLEGNPKMNVIWADTGPATLGALKAIQELKLQGKVTLFGFCAAGTPLDKVIYRGCVGQQPYNYASIVVQNIKKYLAGKSILPTILEPVPAYVSGQTIPAGILG